MLSIQMGNDEFILYIRKRKHNAHGGRSTADLGRKIWLWLKAKGASKIASSQACHWGNLGPFINPCDLPKTATQFEFDKGLLPQLYTFLDTL